MPKDQLATAFDSQLEGGQSIPWMGAFIDGVRAMEASPAGSSISLTDELAAAAREVSSGPSRLNRGR